MSRPTSASQAGRSPTGLAWVPDGGLRRRPGRPAGLAARVRIGTRAGRPRVARRRRGGRRRRRRGGGAGARRCRVRGSHARFDPASTLNRMRFSVLVETRLREGVADPQGTTILRSLPTLGFDGVSGVRVGKAFRFMVDADDEATARAEVEDMCKRFLTNPVIEDATVSVFAAGG